MLVVCWSVPVADSLWPDELGLFPIMQSCDGCCGALGVLLSGGTLGRAPLWLLYGGCVCSSSEDVAIKFVLADQIMCLLSVVSKLGHASKMSSVTVVSMCGIANRL